MEIPILYEDKDLLVINKPAGLVVHSDGKTDEPTLVDWILEHYPKTAGVGEPTVIAAGTKGEKILDRPGIVHRLDRETSGVLLIAKNQKAFLELKRQFQERVVHKTYRAFVHGVITHAAGEVNRPIGRSTKDFRQWTSGNDIRGEARDAVTRYKRLSTYRDYSYIEAEPLTGRTHQIRVHMRAIKHPIVSDSLYSNGKHNELGFTRLALHAAQIDFLDMKGRKIAVEAEIPEDFTLALEMFSDKA